MAADPVTERLHITRSRANPGGRVLDDEGKVAFRSRKPPWLKVPAPGGPTYRRLKKAIENDKKALADLQEEARRAGVPPGWMR